MNISNILASEILDSRGIPTIKTTVELTNGIKASCSIPSGASVGTKEAFELRDNNVLRYNGFGVLNAISNINTILKSGLIGQNILDISSIDNIMCNIDGSDTKSNIGANAILSVSIASIKAGAKATSQEIYRYIGGVFANTLPVPLMNIINGGAHANNNLAIQEFMIVPSGATSFREALRCGAEVFYTLKQICKKRGISTSVGDEGGIAPNLNNDESALELIIEAVQDANYTIGKDVFIALDCAASEFFVENKYCIDNKKLTSHEWIDYLEYLVNRYHIISIEDGMSEHDIDGWRLITNRLNKIQLVGDDIFVSNPTILKACIANDIGNALLVKPNQIGTITETLYAIKIAQSAGYGTIISHRSGETEDTFIADLAVAVNAGQIKTGSLSRSERVAKYNRLLEIENQLFYSHYGK